MKTNQEITMRINQQGAVFVTTMICTLLMLMVGGSLYQLTAHEFIFAKHVDNSMRAQSLAEAGLAKAFATLSTNNFDTNASNFPLTNLDGGTYDASVATVGPRVLVSSVGVYRNIQRTVSAEVIPPTLSALSYALASGGNINWNPGTGGSSGTLTGPANMYAAGNVSIGGTINGAANLYAAGGIIVNTSGNQNITEHPNWGTVVGFPAVTASGSFYQNIAQTSADPSQTYFSTNKTYSSGSPIPATPPGGVIYVNGNISITDDQTTTACIFATGNITISRTPPNEPNITINQYSNYPAMVALGNIAISSNGNSQGGGSFTATGLIYAGGNFDISGNHFNNPRVNITGSILARGNLTTSLTAQNNLQLTFQQQNPPGFNSANAVMSIVSYNS